MKNWPAPTTMKALRGFLGLTSYYKKFIKGYGVISKPFTTLLKKDGFLWNEDAEIAFNKLKNVMCTAPVLALLDFTKPFVVETNACGKGIGVVLMQEGRPIAYLSKALAIKKSSNTLDQRVDSVLQQKWITKLLGLSYEVQYKKGNENRVADALSRREPNLTECQTYGISTQLPLWMQELQTSYEGDTLFQSILQAKILDQQSHPEYKYESGVLRRGNKLCVGSHAGIRERIIKRSKHENNAYPGLLQPLPILNKFGPASLWTSLRAYLSLVLRVKTYADKKRTERKFQVGDEVFLRLQSYNQTTVALMRLLKLSAKYFGPYKVIEKIGKVAYKLALPAGSKIHHVFNVFLLKKKIGSKYFPSMDLPEFEDEVFKIYPIAILGRRLIPRNNVGVPQILILGDKEDKIGRGNVTLLAGNTILKGSHQMEKDDDGRSIQGTIEIGDLELKIGTNVGVSSELGQSRETRDFGKNDRALGTKAQPTGGHASTAGEFIGGRNSVS
ncbi:UNVERIFIED_CONTAM: putative mitochondrial protein [Sesamum radiatum]|uniref:Mitochondrial protein n=1 Tax=Sesamum radiatum TaxID=300843 RepID=A0AAW2PKZ5_SESRA